MRYVGSKNKIAKELVPIIQSYITNDTVGYFEPFVGGANMIDKIDCKNKVGYDIHPQLIALLKQAQSDVSIFPEFISEEEYQDVKNNKEKYPDWYLGLVGFCSSFGAKYFGGYARDSKDDNSGKWSKGAIKNLVQQSENLKDVKFGCKSFQDIDVSKLNGWVIYCDIPYRNTTKYSTKEFPHEEFYSWVRKLSKNNIVLISEYWMPDDFECIYEIEHKTLIDSNKSKSDEKNIRFERLYKKQ